MKRRFILVILALITLLGAVGYLFTQMQVTPARAATAARATGVLTLGALVASVNGAGNTYALQQTNLNFQLSGAPITRVNVDIGDRVKAGDVLAQVDDSDLQFALREAQANFASAQANFENAKAKNAQNPNQLLIAKSQLDKAGATLQIAQADFNAVAWRNDIQTAKQAAILQQATIDYQSALANFNLTAATINDSAYRVALANLEQAQTAVEQAKRNLDKAKIIAPFDGTVAAVNSVVGQLSLSGGGNGMSVITLSNLDSLRVQISLSEVDIAKVRTNQEVLLTVDALDRQNLRGKVASISPVGTITQGVVNYVVTVALAQPNPLIKPGMTANANIVIDRRDNVVMAPNRALRSQGNQRVLTILFEGREIPLFVQTGLSNDQNTEIVSARMEDGKPVALQEGDSVVLNTTTTSGNPRGAPGMVPGLGGFGGMGH